MGKIILYTSGCGKCIVLERKLQAANIDFIKESAFEKLSSQGIMNLPVLEVNGNFYDFSKALKFIKGEEEKNAWKSV